MKKNMKKHCLVKRTDKNESNHIYIKYRKHSRVCTITGKGIESSGT